MRLQEILSPSFKDMLEHPDRIHPSLLVRSCRSDRSDFCLETVDKGWLTQRQMTQAAERYYLGRSHSGKPIFWMIDEQGITRDGHIGDSWVSKMLQARHPDAYYGFIASHCLFGQHLLGVAGRAVGLIESERSAIILSGVYPQMTWMAWVYPCNLTVELLKVLKGRQVILYPRASETMDYYMSCFDTADYVRRNYGLDITVSPILEQHATIAQKQSKIDLVDFLFAEGPALQTSFAGAACRDSSFSFVTERKPKQKKGAKTS